MANLREKFMKELAPELQKKLGLTNKMLVPRLEKVVLNMGFGIVEKDLQKQILDDLAKITGQRPVTCKARKSISNFKLRQGMIIGAKVTPVSATSTASRTGASTGAATTRSGSRSTRSSRR